MINLDNELNIIQLSKGINIITHIDNLMKSVEGKQMIAIDIKPFINRYCSICHRNTKHINPQILSQFTVEYHCEICKRLITEPIYTPKNGVNISIVRSV